MEELKIIQNLVLTSKWNIKCPYKMIPKGVAIHNTANTASASAEISYMSENEKQVSYHWAVDDIQAIQGVLETRNAWHAGDGADGEGNRNYIAIEICYSKDYTSDKYPKSEDNGALLTAKLLYKYGWDISKVKRHYDFTGKDCPHRMLWWANGKMVNEDKWLVFLDTVQDYLNQIKVINLDETVEIVALPLEFNEGDNIFTVNGAKVNLTLNEKDEVLDTVSFGWKEVKTINEFLIDNITCVVNGNYFENHSDAYNFGEIYGRNQSICCNKDDTPSPDKWYDVVVIDNDKIVASDMENWEYPKSEGATFGATTSYIKAYNDRIVNLESRDSKGGLSRKHNQTFMCKFNDGHFGLGVVETILPNDLYEYLNKYNGGIDHLSFYDHGGSTQKATIRNNKEVYTGRKIPQCLVFRKVAEVIKPIEEEATQTPIGSTINWEAKYNEQLEINQELTEVLAMISDLVDKY